LPGYSDTSIGSSRSTFAALWRRALAVVGMALLDKSDTDVGMVAAYIVIESGLAYPKKRLMVHHF
jgi:hypothetical protein